MSGDEVVVRPAWPTLSRTTKWIGGLALPWFFGVLLLADVLGVSGPGGPPVMRGPVLAFACLPGLTFILSRWLGRIPAFRWMHDPIPPCLTIAADELRLLLPDTGVRAFRWQEIESLRIRPNGTADLLARDGVILARLPESIVKGGPSWLTTESIATLVVRQRPDLFRLSGANWAGEPNEFARGVANPADKERWVRRRLVILLVAIAAIIASFALPLIFQRPA